MQSWGDLDNYRYLAPELHQLEDGSVGEILVTKESDMYGMGMVIFEVRSHYLATSGKSPLLLSANLFLVVSPAKFGRLRASYFQGADTWLSEVHFQPLAAAFRAFGHFESDRGIS